MLAAALSVPTDRRPCHGAGEPVRADLGDEHYRLFCHAKQAYVDHVEPFIVGCRVSAACAFLGHGGFPRLVFVSKPPLVIHGSSQVNGSISGTKLAAFMFQTEVTSPHPTKARAMTDLDQFRAELAGSLAGLSPSQRRKAGRDIDASATKTARSQGAAVALATLAG
jgi:hypothetical protein